MNSHKNHVNSYLFDKSFILYSQSDHIIAIIRLLFGHWRENIKHFEGIALDVC